MTHEAALCAIKALSCSLYFYSSGPLTYDNASFVHRLRTTDLRLISILFSMSVCQLLLMGPCWSLSKSNPFGCGDICINGDKEKGAAVCKGQMEMTVEKGQYCLIIWRQHGSVIMRCRPMQLLPPWLALGDDTRAKYSTEVSPNSLSVKRVDI